MTVSFGTSTDPINRINKSYTEVLSADCKLKDDTSIIDPVIVVSTGNTIVGCNYAYISDFGRYYYIKDIKSITANHWQISMHVDVLKSFSAGIYASPCIIAKNADYFNLYINDSNFKCQQNDVVLKQVFPHGFDEETDSFVMAIIGEKVSAS